MIRPEPAFSTATPCGVAHADTIPPAPVRRARSSPVATMPDAPSSRHAEAPEALAPIPPPPDLDLWATVQAGDVVRWTPAPRVAARGVAEVRGTVRSVGRATKATYAQLDTATGSTRVWSNQGTLTREGAAVPPPPVPRSEPVAETREARPARGSRAVAKPEPGGLAKPVRAKPVDGWRGPPETIKALHSVETVLPLLAAPPFSFARAAVAAVRRWIETGVDDRASHRFGAEALEKLQAIAEPAQNSALWAVNWLVGGQVDRAHEIARDLAEVLRADAAGFDYAKALAEGRKDPALLRAFEENPTLTLPPPPPGDLARRKVIEIAVAADDGYTMRAKGRIVRPYDQMIRSDEARAWKEVTEGHGEALRRRHAQELLNAKELLLGTVAMARRGKEDANFWSRVYAASEALARYRRVQLYEAALAAGLASPADAAAEVLMAQIRGEETQCREVLGRVGPRVERILTAAATALRTEAERAARAIEEARTSRKELRVPQTADVAAIVSAKLTEAASELNDPKVEWASRLHTLLWLAKGDWPRWARKVGNDWQPLVTHTDAAYARPMRKLLDMVAERPVAELAVATMKKIGWPDAIALADADRRLHQLADHTGAVGPWNPTHGRQHAHSVGPEWQGYATGARQLPPARS